MENKNKDFYMQRGFVATMKTEKRSDEIEGEKLESNIIDGLAAVYDQDTVIKTEDDEFVEVIRNGAFNETDMTDVLFTVNHNLKNIPLARSRNNNKSNKPNTMKLSLNDEGLHVEANLDVVNNPQAATLYSAVDRGDMDGMSFIFFVSEENQNWTIRDGMKYREILKVNKIIEVSAVNFPAYEGTSLDARSLDSDKLALENANISLTSSLDNEDAGQKTEEKITVRSNPIYNYYFD